MANSERSIPDADVDGFIALDDFVARAFRLSADELARAYPVPALLVTSLPDAAPLIPGAKLGQEVPIKRLEQSYRTTADEAQPLPDPVAVQLRYAGRVAFLTKRPGNHFPDMISIGRALNCDLILALTSVSKIHGLFHREAGGRWTYSDQASRNGTLLGGRKLSAGARHPLKDGDSIQVGLHFAALFLEPASLVAKLRPRR